MLKMNLLKSSLLLIAILISGLGVSGQEVAEPEFIGEAFVLKADGSNAPLDKEIADFKSGMSWSANSWKALTLEVVGGKAKSRFPAGPEIQLVVKAVDNNSDPLAVVSIYKLKAKSKSRTVLLSEDNSGTFMKSKTTAKALVRFTGKKYGKSSYLITLSGIEAGEYGVVVANPNSNDQKRVVVSCFAVD